MISIYLAQALYSKEVIVTGAKDRYRDFVYIDDVVEAFLLAGSNEEINGKVLNLGDDNPISLLDLVELLIELNGGGRYSLVPFPTERRKIDIGDYYGDYSRIRTVLKWKPSTSLRDGLTRTINFYKKYREYYW